jgi:hypothetical protein
MDAWLLKTKGLDFKTCCLKIEERNFLCSVAKTALPGTGPGI